MALNAAQQQLLRRLPSVDALLLLTTQSPAGARIPKSIQIRAIRKTIGDLRQRIVVADDSVDAALLDQAQILTSVLRHAEQLNRRNLIPLINATGVIVHTNLGRSLLADTAIAQINQVAQQYSNLEYTLAEGHRGSRYSAVEDIICEISGAEAAMVVNNNAGAVLLSLNTLASGREVIVSRGELVEIGGSFRIPDVMSKSGCLLKEVGTTNRTHRKDYAQAIGEETALLLKVHKSNYSVVGFSTEVSVKELVDLAREHQLPVMEDLGSGTFIDFSEHGLLHEPTVQESVASGADVVTFSGDKLLGGPQGGIIVGKRALVEKIKQNPLARALRIDKLTLAALEGTLRLYRDPRRAITAIPTLRMMTMPMETIQARAEQLKTMLATLDDPCLQVHIVERASRIGGGALPLQALPSRCVALTVTDHSANAIERHMRLGTPPIIGRIESDLYLLDVRTLLPNQFEPIVAALGSLLQSDVNSD